MDVIKDQFSIAEHNRDRRMSSIDRNILLKPIAVDVTKWFLGATCGKEDLVPGDFAIDQKVSKRFGTIETSEQRKDFSDRSHLHLERKEWI
jgi:hypothetical protein